MVMFFVSVVWNIGVIVYSVCVVMCVCVCCIGV